LGQGRHERLSQVQRVGAVGLAGRLDLGQHLRTPLAASPLVDGEVVQRAAQVPFLALADAAPPPHEPFQRGLQEVFAGGAAARQQYRGRE
jgi:hypothetical protein